MFSNEVIPMAVKKSPKGGAKKAKAAKKAAPKKAKAAKKAAPKKAAPKKAPPKASAKKAAPKKAAAVKLTDAQKGILRRVMETKLNGLIPPDKPTAKTLSTLLAKRLVKKGKKEGQICYLITKLGEKYTPAVPAAPEPVPSVPPM
jgi:hypothetical protein